MYGNFDIVLDHFSRSFMLYTTQHTPCDMEHALRSAPFFFFFFL